MTLTPEATAPATAEVASGAWFHNPVTGELARMNVGPADTAGRRVDADLWLQPGAAVAAAHVHDRLVERFEVLSGSVGFKIAGQERTSGPGDGPTEIAVGVEHDWWNSGDGIAHVRVQIEAAPNAPGRPAARFVSVIETTWSLGALGKVNAKGMPDPLWLAAIAREYGDVIRFSVPPALVQTAVFGPLAALARRTGRDPLAAELHGAGAPCALPEPSDATLAELLARPAGTR